MIDHIIQNLHLYIPGYIGLIGLSFLGCLTFERIRNPGENGEELMKMHGALLIPIVGQVLVLPLVLFCAFMTALDWASTKIALQIKVHLNEVARIKEAKDLTLKAEELEHRKLMEEVDKEMREL